MRKPTALFATLLILLAFGSGAPAQEAGTADDGHVVLRLENGSFHGFARLRTPRLVDKDGQLKPLLELAQRGQKEADRKPVPTVVGAPPPADWKDAGFDTGQWPRLREAFRPDILSEPQPPRSCLVFPKNR
jgi:hypothetical protein